MKLLAALLLALAPAGATVQSVTGDYRLSQMEMAGGLSLQAGGRFRYELDYGAVSEAAEGRWSLDSDGVRLTSEPMDPEVLHDLERNDARMNGQLLRVDGDSLVMERYEARMIFQRVRP